MSETELDLDMSIKSLLYLALNATMTIQCGCCPLNMLQTRTGIYSERAVAMFAFFGLSSMQRSMVDPGKLAPGQLGPQDVSNKR